MPRTTPRPRHWWQRRLPSVTVLLVVLGVVGFATVSVAGRVADVLPDVGKDQLGEDRWNDPIGLEKAGELSLAHIPDCAAGSVTRIVLWDADSNPYWEVTGPATPMASFVVGVAPTGFVEVTPYREPPAGEVLRLVAFRRVGGPAGIRYQMANLRPERVVSGQPLARYTVSGYQTAEVCGETAASVGPSSTTVTTPDGAPVTTTSAPG